MVTVSYSAMTQVKTSYLAVYWSIPKAIPFGSTVRWRHDVELADTVPRLLKALLVFHVCLKDRRRDVLEVTELDKGMTFQNRCDRFDRTWKKVSSPEQNALRGEELHLEEAASIT